MYRQQAQLCFLLRFLFNLVVGFFFNPSSGVSSEHDTSQLIIDPDDEREGKSGQPPGEVKRVSTEGKIKSWAVAHEGGQTRLKDNTGVEYPVIHSLLEDGQSTSLADDDISPLHDDNGDEEGRVTGVLNNLTIGIRPLLAVRILDLVEFFIVPLFS